MIIIKGWVDHKNLVIMSKACENIAVETAMKLIEAAKTGSTEGNIRLPGGRMLQYNRYSNGRIIIKQLA